jgi:hypothetical protein
MAHALQQFASILTKMLEQLAVRTEDGRLIFQDMLCMSWVAVCDVDRPDQLEASPPNRPQT